MNECGPGVGRAAAPRASGATRLVSSSSRKMTDGQVGSGVLLVPLCSPRASLGTLERSVLLSGCRLAEAAGLGAHAAWERLQRFL